jgi:hypothetical protein
MPDHRRECVFHLVLVIRLLLTGAAIIDDDGMKQGISIATALVRMVRVTLP